MPPSKGDKPKLSMKLLIGLLFIALTFVAFFAYKDHFSNASETLSGKLPITTTNEALSTGQFQPTLENQWSGFLVANSPWGQTTHLTWMK